ncbi:MAG: hypothetical protein ACLTUN_07420 [Paraclostridium sordellii]
MCDLKFYEGRKIENRTVCNNCNKDIVWYNLFPQPGTSSFITNIIPCDDNVSSARVRIVNEENDRIDVEVSYRCKFCDEYHKIEGIIVKKDNKLVFEEI